MVAIDFSTSPTNGQVFTAGDKTWTYSTAVGAFADVEEQIETRQQYLDRIFGQWLEWAEGSTQQNNKLLH